MKKIIKTHFLAIAAVVTILGFSAFKAIEKSNQTGYYWFEFDASGTNLVNQSVEPELLEQNPFECEGEEQHCAQAFTSYDEVSTGNFAPQTPAMIGGNPIIRDKDL